MISLNTIKQIYHKTPAPVKKSLLHVPYSIFLGKLYRDHVAYLKSFEECSFEQKKLASEKRLLNYLNEAIHDTPFYIDFAKKKGWKEIIDMEQFYELPLITKEQLTDNLDWFTSQNVTRKYNVTTGGTSGKQTELFMSNEAYRIEWAYKKCLLDKHSININSRRVCLRGVDFYGDKNVCRYNPLYKELLISPFRMSSNNIEEIFKEIEQHKPTWLHGYPSSISEFAKLCKANGKSYKNFKFALLVSEALYPDQEKAIKEVFDIDLASFYGMTERVIFAPASNSGGFVPDLSYGYTEEHNGELVGSGYINDATRLIRYRTGDEVEVEKDGQLVTHINSIKGRWSTEYLVTRSNVKLTMAALNVHSDELSFVKRYQFFQNEKGKCELRIIPNTKVKPTHQQLEAARGVFQAKVEKELDIAVSVVDDIPLTKRGKHKFIQSTLY